MSNKSATQEVLAMHEISFTGNVTPHSWYQLLTYDDGKANLPAIVILSEICYWYRPRLERDEYTGEITAIEKRFSADKLQRSYASFSNLGLSKKQAYDACHYLVKKGLITLETRTITLESGRKIPNELYIGIVPAEIAKLNSAKTLIKKVVKPKNPEDTWVSPTSDTVSHRSNDLSRTGETNTENTSEITTKTTHTENPPVPARPLNVSPPQETVCVSAFSEFQRKSYAVNQFPVLGDGWIGKSKNGEWDNSIRSWIEKAANQRKIELITPAHNKLASACNLTVRDLTKEMCNEINLVVDLVREKHKNVPENYTQALVKIFTQVKDWRISLAMEQGVSLTKIKPMALFSQWSDFLNWVRASQSQTQVTKDLAMTALPC